MSCPDGLFRCPITKTRLAKIPPDKLRALNDAISRGELSHADGTRASLTLEEAYVSEGASFAYGAREGIVFVLPALALVLNPHSAPHLPTAALGEDKKLVQEFYNQVGWKTEGGVYVDSLKFVDLRPVSHAYFQRIHERTRGHLNPTGRFILDAASGAIPHPGQFIYSEGFDYRICVDFSFSALQAARNKLGAKGIYVLGDITNLPLLDESVDAVISLHTLYHVPAGEQKTALHEIYRVLKPEGCAVIVYSWGERSVLMRLASPHNRLNRTIINAVAFLTRLQKRETTDRITDLRSESPVKLYFHVHPYSWFAREFKALAPFKLACWRSVNAEFQRTYIREWLYGKQILATIAWLESKFPWIFGRLGQYPMFVIRKPSVKCSTH
jgi:ubiquinone/menaquinone biosynthesis C-methylase UbiE